MSVTGLADQCMICNLFCTSFRHNFATIFWHNIDWPCTPDKRAVTSRALLRVDWLSYTQLGYDWRRFLNVLRIIIVKWTHWQSSTVVRRRERIASPSHVYKTQLNSTQLAVELSWVELHCVVGHALGISLFYTQLVDANHSSRTTSVRFISWRSASQCGSKTGQLCIYNGLSTMFCWL